MVRQRLSKFAFYRFRYVLAYAIFALSLATMLLVAGFYLPGGLTNTEINSALISDNLDPSQLFALKPEQLIYLPYRLQQAASISVFGISVIAIKLPSIILGFISALGILYLLNLWYRRSVAIIVAIVAVTTNQFLLSSQAGQAGIVYIFLTTMILIAASMVARRNAYAQLWVIVGFVLAAISMYMPLSVYILLALVLTAFIHPHARHVLLRQSLKSVIAVGALLFVAIVSPLVLGIINDPSILKTLLGVSENINNLSSNASILSQNYTQFANPTSGTVLTPVYGLPLVLLFGLGIYRLVSAKYTTKSYVISFSLLLLVPLVCLNPSFVSIAFLPVILVIALAIDYLISSWYSLFPRNPYARIFGLLPLAVLVLGIVVSSVDRYVYGLHYDREVYSAYSTDITLLSNELNKLDNSTSVQLITTKRDVPFYSSFARHQTYVKNLQVSSDVSLVNSSAVTIVDRQLKENVNKTPSDIIVTRTAENADRYYVYKNK